VSLWLVSFLLFKESLDRFLTAAYISQVMSSTRTFFYFAFTYRFFFFEESGPAKFENEVLKT